MKIGTITQQKIDKYPLVSVIIPVYNDPEGIKDTVESLVCQDYPKAQYEILIVDNGSSQATLDVIDQLKEKYCDLVRALYENEIQGSYAARNKGVRHARGEILSFIDADMTVKPDWLRRVVTTMQEEKVSYLGCNVRLYTKTKSFASMYNLQRGFPIKSDVENNHFAPTCCLTVRKEVFDKVGLFDYRLESGGDFEFGNRVYNNGIALYYAPHLKMYHPARGTLRSLINKSMRVGRGVAQLVCFYPEHYGYLSKKYFSIRRYLPSKPWLVRSRCKCGYSLSWISVISLSFFPVLPKLLSLFSFIRKKATCK